MREKFLNLTFRRRQRVIYDKQELTPVGLSEEIRNSKVKAYGNINLVELKEEVFRLIGLILAHH